MKDSTHIILWAIGIVATFLSTLVATHPDILFQPVIKISVNLFADGNSTATLAQVKIENVGSQPAKNVRLTINPSHDIIRFKTDFHTEELTLIDNGPRSLIGLMPRLAQNTYVTINTWLNATKTDITFYDIYVTSDQGSQRYYLGKERLDVINSLAYSALAALTVLLIRLIKKKFKEQTPDRYVIDLARKLEKLVIEFDENFLSHIGTPDRRAYPTPLLNLFSYIQQLSIQWDGKGDEPYTVSEINSRLSYVATGLMYLKRRIKHVTKQPSLLNKEILQDLIEEFVMLINQYPADFRLPRMFEVAKNTSISEKEVYLNFRERYNSYLDRLRQFVHDAMQDLNWTPSFDYRNNPQDARIIRDI